MEDRLMYAHTNLSGMNAFYTLQSVHAKCALYICVHIYACMCEYMYKYIHVHTINVEPVYRC